MKGWWVDDYNGPYHTAYCLAFKKAMGLSFANRISVPDACALSTEYLDTQERLLILGKNRVESTNLYQVSMLMNRNRNRNGRNTLLK
jgi:hypothetical protein